MSAKPRTAAGAFWPRALLVWALLLVFLGANLLAAHRLGAPWGPALTFGLAATQAGLVAFSFMRLATADRLVRLAAACGLFWLAILFTLTLTDTLSRLANV